MSGPDVRPARPLPGSAAEALGRTGFEEKKYRITIEVETPDSEKYGGAIECDDLEDVVEEFDAAMRAVAGKSPLRAMLRAAGTYFRKEIEKREALAAMSPEERQAEEKRRTARLRQAQALRSPGGKKSN